MKLAVDHGYTIQNMVTGETTLCHVHEILEYRGHAIILGITSRHGIFTTHHLVVEGRPAFFVMLTDAPGDLTLQLSKEAKGLSLALLDTQELGSSILGVSTSPLVGAYPIFNSGWPGPFGSGAARTREQRILRGQKMIDSYLTRKELP